MSESKQVSCIRCGKPLQDGEPCDCSEVSCESWQL
jgi:hypothetical protein